MREIPIQNSPFIYPSNERNEEHVASAWRKWKVNKAAAVPHLAACERANPRNFWMAISVEHEDVLLSRISLPDTAAGEHRHRVRRKRTTDTAHSGVFL